MRPPATPTLRTGGGSTGCLSVPFALGVSAGLRVGSFMAKRANDLLDVFRLGSGAADAPPRPRRKKGGARRKKAKAGAEGVVLAPRQVTLLASTAVLLVVLAFAAGLGYGRRKPGPALSRVAQSNQADVWWIRGLIRAYDEFTGRPVPIESIERDLEAQLKIRGDNLRVLRENEERYALLLGPFQTEAKARAWYEQKRLGVVRVRNWGTPFYRHHFETRPADVGR